MILVSSNIAAGYELRSNNRQRITNKNPGKLSNDSIACAAADVAAVGIYSIILMIHYAYDIMMYTVRSHRRR